MQDFDFDGFGGFEFGEDDNESSDVIIENALVKKSISAKTTMKSALKKELIATILPELPKHGEYIHVVSNGKFDYFGFAPQICGLLGNKDIEYYGCTWTMNMKNARQLIDLIEQGVFSKATLIVGTYFKTREPQVYGYLDSKLSKYGMRFRFLETHAKIMMFRHGENAIVLEGSANFTANPRIEQNIICNSSDLYGFHSKWIDGLFRK